MKKLKSLTALGMSVALVLSVFTGCGIDSSASAGKKTAKVIDINLTNEEYAFGVEKSQDDLLATVNEFIAEIKADGTFDEICNNYFGDGTPTPITSAELDTSKDQLVVATNAAFEPFEFTKGDQYLGIDMEIAAALAKKLGQELVIQNMDFDSVCLAVGQQKCDIAMAGLTIKEDRLQYVNFTDPYYSASQKLIVTSDNTEFDNCKDAVSIEEILTKKDASVKVGVQNGTTGQFYCEGDEEWGFSGFAMETIGYKNGSLAVQDLLNNNINYVIIDSAPAQCITQSINALQ